MSLSIPPIRDSALQAKSEKRFALTQFWEIEVKRASDAQTVEVLDVADGGVVLSLRKRQSAGYYRLLHALDSALLGELDGVSFRFVCRTDNASLFDWGAILQEQADGHRAYVVKGSRNVSRHGGNVIIEGAIEFRTSLWTQALRPYLAFQCSSEAGNLEITSMQVSLLHKAGAAARKGLSQPSVVQPGSGASRPADFVPRVPGGEGTTSRSHAPAAPYSSRRTDARKLLLKIEKAVLGNLNELSRGGKGPLRLETNVATFAEALYARTHGDKINARLREVATDIVAMKQLLAGSSERRFSDGSEQTSEYSADLRSKILQAVSKTAGQLRTPYYVRLAEAVAELGDPQLLGEVWRTLHDIDLARYGHVPRPVGPFVSVVMPAYNRQDVVADAVASVLAQTYPNFELLVCDDASLDGTPAALDTFRDGRLRVLRHPHRQGAAAARNTCLREARGDFIAYLDSDNLWHPRFLELMLEQLKSCPGNVAGYSSYFDVHLNDGGEARLKKAEIRSFSLEDQLEVPFVDLNSFVHRRELGEVFGYFDERLVRRQDYDIISRYCWVREPQHVPYAMNIYQRIPSMSRSLAFRRVT